MVEFISNNLWIIWLTLFVIALLVEWGTSELVSIWFALGAVIALILSFIPNVAWWVQLIVFVVISIAAFAFLRPIVKKFMKNNIVDTNIDEIVGKKGYMTEDYTDTNRGEVKINGVLWTAVNTEENKTLPRGTKVVVLAVEGNKLIVKEVKEN